MVYVAYANAAFVPKWGCLLGKTLLLFSPIQFIPVGTYKEQN
jgi:hypothetical protein